MRAVAEFEHWRRMALAFMLGSVNVVAFNDQVRIRTAIIRLNDI